MVVLEGGREGGDSRNNESKIRAQRTRKKSERVANEPRTHANRRARKVGRGERAVQRRGRLRSR